MYGSTTEEQRQANEVRRLKRELHDARDQVMSLSSQLSTNVSELKTNVSNSKQTNLLHRFFRDELAVHSNLDRNSSIFSHQDLFKKKYSHLHHSNDE